MSKMPVVGQNLQIAAFLNVSSFFLNISSFSGALWTASKMPEVHLKNKIEPRVA